MKNRAQLLKEHNLKSTPQRLKIISIMEKSGHISVEDLYEKIKEDFPTLSLATIYKNIHQMIENGLIKEVKVPDKKSVYEITKEPHLHMICSQCGKIEDISMKTDQVIQNAENLTHYRINDSFITLRGICPECQKLENAQPA